MRHRIAPFAFLTVALLTGGGASAAERPNILYFYVDDMGWGSIAPNGQADRKSNDLPYVRTPHLDHLASEGINFGRAYGCHVCSPARSSQQTGFHQGHTFADRNDPNNAKKAMRAADVCMGDALSAAGYATGYWGKWGYGGSKDKVKPTIDNVQTLPTSHGYQFVLAELHHVRAHTFFQPTLWSAPASPGAVGRIELVPNTMAPYRNTGTYPATPAMQSHADYPEVAYCDDAYAFAALDFVRTQGQEYNRSGKPFFGLFACQIPHAPFKEITVLPEWSKAYADDPHFAGLADQTKQWAAMVTRIDAHFGNILAALDDPNNDGDAADSIRDNTLVIFQSDNGGPGGQSNAQLDTNGGLRGTKGKIQEGGIRVPLVMRWPAKIHAESALKAGTTTDQVVDVTDLLPTFCELAGQPAPLGIDGVSIAPSLTGSGLQRPREFVIHEAGNGQSIIRGKHKLVRSGKKGALALYDLVADHAEENDIATDNPELVKELEALLLGERVAEPRGFANTYHRWTGKDGADATSPGNWSDYVYENAGITYMTDAGAPQLSWIAHMVNQGTSPGTARAASDLAFLGLEIRGNTENAATQTLTLPSGVKLTGRNEVRLGAGGILELAGGQVSTMRWVDVQTDGKLSGSGSIDGIVYNGGTINVSTTQGVRISKDYHQSASGELAVSLGDTGMPALSIGGTTQLSGKLLVTLGDGFKTAPGKAYTVLTAKEITGRFDIPGDELTVGGTRFAIRYTSTTVILAAK